MGLEEAVDAIATDLSTLRFSPKDRIPVPWEVRSPCSSLVSVTTIEDVWGQRTVLQLAHPSVREHLTSGEVTGRFWDSLLPMEANAAITRTCLAYLISLSLEDSVDQTGTRFSLAQVWCVDEDTPKYFDALKNIKTRFPLAAYSAEYWIYHARPVDALKTVQTAIQEFRNNKAACRIWGCLFIRNPWELENSSRWLHLASIYGLGRTAQVLLKDGADVNFQCEFGSRPLMNAAFAGHGDIVRMLLENGADVNADDVLRAASSAGHGDIVRMLLENGADVNADDVLRAASLAGHGDIVRMLLENGADVNADDGFRLGSALRAASWAGHGDIVEILLDNHVPVNALDRDGR